MLEAIRDAGGSGVRSRTVRAHRSGGRVTHRGRRRGGEGSAIDALTGLIDFDAASGTVGVRTGTWMGPVSVNAEFRDSPAADLGEDWDDVVEFSCFSASGIVVGEFMDEVQLLTVTEAAGEFRVRICARGRAASAERDDLKPDLDDDGEPIFVTEPVEFYLIQVWPAPATPAEVLKRGTNVHLRSATLGTDRQTTHSGGPAPADPWKTTAVLAASKQIADVLNQRPLATDNLAELDDVFVQRVVLKSPKTLFRQLRNNGLAPETCSSGVNPDWRWNEGHQCFFPDEHPDHLWTGRHGEVRCVWAKAEPPRLLTKTWDWYLPPTVTDDHAYSMVEVKRLPIQTSLVVIELEPVRHAGKAATRLHLRHQQLPAVWVTR